MLQKMTMGNGMNGGAGKQGLVSGGGMGSMQPMEQPQSQVAQGGSKIMIEMAKAIKAIDERTKVIEQKMQMIDDMIATMEQAQAQETQPEITGGEQNGNIPQY